jgi:hypothetical protein
VPVNTTPPTISGTAQVGQTVTATNGTWANSPTSFTYQWNRAGSAISGAAASAYVPVAADVGNTLAISVTATNGSGSSTPAASAATGAVIDIIATNSSVPTISGTAQVGQTLTATTGIWTHNPTSFTYQWNRAGGAISGATASTYVPVAADVGGRRRRQELGRLQRARDKRGHDRGYRSIVRDTSKHGAPHGLPGRSGRGDAHGFYWILDKYPD